MPRRLKKEVDWQYWCESAEGLNKIREWVEAGLSDQQIAKNITINRKTLTDWKNKHDLFYLTYKKAKGVAVTEVVNALFKSAKGHYANEQVIDNKGNKRVIRKYIAPNVAAGIFLAKNWAPHEYKDKWDIDVSGRLPIVISGDDDIAD